MKPGNANYKEYPVLEFSEAAAWREWLDKNHDRADGAWLRFYKKGSGKQTFTYREALDDALCYGWIDGQAKSHDHASYIQKFTMEKILNMLSNGGKFH